MGLLDRLFGTSRQPASRPRYAPQPEMPQPNAAHPSGASDDDRRALERYRYMIQTAPPETIEQAHAEAFEKLSPEQRRQILGELARLAPAHERAALESTSSDDPRALARVATRAEVRQPGVMERVLGAGRGPGMGMGMGSGMGMGMGATLLGSFAAAFAGSMVANSFFSAIGGFDGFDGDALASAGGLGAAEDGDALGDLGDDGGGFDGADIDF